MLPLFPLPNVVLFPNVFLPLHIFEERYRVMVRDALAGDRLIGMVLLRETGPTLPDEPPPIYRVGCAGVISHAEPLEDGRFDIVLRGVEKFRVLDEDRTRPYRRARTESLVDAVGDAVALAADRERLERLLDRRLSHAGTDSRIPKGMSDADLVNALSQYLEFDPVERQALLERDTLSERCRSLIDLLEMRLLAGAHDAPITPQ